jgi:hypothetical protein
VGCLASAGLGMRKLGACGVVVTTDPVSADADFDKGASLHGTPRLRGFDGGTAYRLACEAREEAKRAPKATRYNGLYAKRPLDWGDVLCGWSLCIASSSPTLEAGAWT